MLWLDGEDLGGSRLHNGQIAASAGQHVPVALPPAVIVAVVGDDGQRRLLLAGHAVLGQQLAEARRN